MPERQIIKPRLSEAERNSPVAPREVNYRNFLPFGFAAAMPLVRIGLRGRVSQPVLDRIFLGVVFTALGHAGYVMIKSDI
mmetsp:Transcript_18463/g.53895  ORF Transcript_18463/g.53895 Transcript_18463/m.53895 type:complete len:80 (+) Transcript_18463:132-371(+)